MADQYTIRKAEYNDIPAIVTMARANDIRTLLDEMYTDEAEKRGFLISAYGVRDYERLLYRHPGSLVLEACGKVVAFLIGQDERELDLGKMLNIQLFAQGDRPFAVIKQICVAPEHMGKGYGRALYQQYIKAVRRDVYAAVVMHPDLSNHASVAFHQKLGFEKVFENVGEDTLDRWVFRRSWGTIDAVDEGGERDG
ncbi:GNAT family N-acetyltransferase [Ruminococcaceae bacterium OttesenSCG-928-A11]|nr:GNAT family N-acetyltransferase [Ruminococcaceae bacterium OttesenSCG-928-A11]